MTDNLPIENDFLQKLKEIIGTNISNEKFGVSELAHEAGMSRSNLLRKVQKLAHMSVSQFIRNVRLQKAIALLKEKQLSVSEIAYHVGFSSTSYFVKCFREQYGYPPGEYAKHTTIEIAAANQDKYRKFRILALSTLLLLICLTIFYFINSAKKTQSLEKSIAVLPFINDSNDSSNVYIINGLMDAILYKLQAVEDLRVISRTSVEKYRNSGKSISDIAKELQVNYIVEGSGQKIGSQILLNVQLIEGAKDKHLWARQYRNDSKDIFQLQLDVAKSITHEIQAIITPEEEKLMKSKPTNNLEAYDLFLKGLELINTQDPEKMLTGIEAFKQAIRLDEEFGQAYAYLAITYYYLDIFKTKKSYTQEINSYADKALLYDPKTSYSTLAKAMYYMHISDYNQAITYLEKAHEFNPNSTHVLNFLSDFYTSYVPNTEKYLKYALKGVRLDLASKDSSAASFLLLHLSNAFIQTGFVHEAEQYVNQSLAYNPGNIYSHYVKAYIVYARNKDLAETKEALQQTLQMDTNRLDVLQELGKICYYMRDYEAAYYYYHKFNSARLNFNLDIYPNENLIIAYVFNKVGETNQIPQLMNRYEKYMYENTSIYKNLVLAVYHAYLNDNTTALKYFELFSQEDNYHYWTLLFLDKDPMVENLKNDPEFMRIMKGLEEKFWQRHKSIKAQLKTDNLI